MADQYQSMPAKLRKVDGGYELFIPDDYAAATGLTPELIADLELMGDMLWVRQPEFIAKKREEMWTNFHPSQLHDPHEPYPLPPEMGAPSR